MAVEKVGLYHDKRMASPWIIRWFGESNERGSPRRYSQSFRLKRDAIAFQAAKQAELDTGGQRDKLEITLEELCNKYLESRKHRLRNASLAGYKNTIPQLKDFFSPTCPIRKITLEQAERFIATRQLVHPQHKKEGKQLSSWARNLHLRLAKAIFNKAVEWGYIRKNPFSGIKKLKHNAKPWHFITADEFKSLLAAAPNKRIQTLYAVMYGCGLRYGEAINLLWNGNDVNFERGRINVTNREPTRGIPGFFIKDYEARSISMPNWLQDILIELQAESSEGCPYVFLTKERWETVRINWQKLCQAGKAKEWENRNTANNHLRSFRVHCRKAGILTDEKLTLHCLRKSFAQNLADASTPAPTLLKLMGHSSLDTTEEFYMRSSDANEMKACQVIDNLMEMKKSDVKMTFKPQSSQLADKTENVNPCDSTSYLNRGDRT